MPKAPDLIYIPASFDLEPELIDQLSPRPGMQRCIAGRYELLLLVHEPPLPGSADRSPAVFWRREDGLWMDGQGSKGLRRLGEVVERYVLEVRDSSEALGKAASAEEVFALARTCGPLAHSARHLAVAIEQALGQDEDSRELRLLRDKAREMELAAELLHQEARLTLDFRRASGSDPRPENLHQLHRAVLLFSVFAAFFAPLAALTGLFSMNGAPSVHGAPFWILLALGIGAGAGAGFAIIRHLGKLR